ncbi:MAG: aminotransferase class I/II-fold pyridoxal phosphate-dependent enzyme [Alphaproteobacteria bacterium]|nr:aminotransferase class I/II-fold pyridoxal phosphate-dependent enzyme [Alphaproteobacteria bacterium]
MSAPLSTRDNNGSDFMTMTAPQPKQTIASMLSYRPSFGAPSAGRLIRLSANEGALGCSPKALEALQKSAIDPSRYPEIQDHQLNEAIAERYNLDAGRILTSNGSDELISLLTLAYLEPGDEVVMSEYAFLVIPQATQIAGGVSVKAADIDMTVSVDNLLAAVTERTKIVFLVNPNNPTGTMISHEEVARLHKNLPPHILLVLDWAYAEYLEDGFSDAAARMVEEHNNVVMTRTFSKLHGMAGLRLGWAYCPFEILTTLASIRGPFSVNQAAVMAGVAAVKDTEFQAKSIAHNRKWMAVLPAFLTQLGIEVIPSETNFILMRFDPAKGVSAMEAEKFFSARNILLRSMGAYGLGDYLRMSIGTDEEMEILKDAFIVLMQSASRPE